MDVKTLREIQRKEKMSPYLQDIGKDFYQELRGYLREVLEGIKDAKGSDTSSLALKLAEFENIKNIVSDLYETRERKIVSNALYYVKSGDAVEAKNLVTEEEEVLRKIVDLLRSKRQAVLDRALHGKRLVQKDKPMKLAEKKKPSQPPLKQEFLTVRVLKDLPSIVGVDGRVYGAFKTEDLVTMPKANAETFINRGVAEKVDVDK
jgi:DNA replication initiation complex subunit (GINS family)